MDTVADRIAIEKRLTRLELLMLVNMALSTALNPNVYSFLVRFL